jgi:Tol biopolymer transport system component
MGEVWKATDTRLGREVAIKTLPDEFAKDPERLARFAREARLLASLNHPNIAAIHGFEEDAGIRFLVLELVPGDTLASRIERGAIPAKEALRFALQIAEALEAAHESGVVHRDLKPANIKITPEGRVKVLDFGLAKALSADQTEVDLSQSPTLSVAGTREGVLLGTAAYMSPEQASGGNVDKRTDIWSFGVVLFEMLTGQALFSGETVSHLLAAVLRDEPEWVRLPPGLHPQIRFLLKRCLEKKVRDRSHDISDARVTIRNTLDDPAGVFVATADGTTKASKSMGKWILAGALVLAISVLGAAYLRTPQAGPAMRFAATLPGGVDYSVGEDFLRSASLSPNGRTLVFTGVDNATGRALLYKRSIDAIEAVPLEGTEDGAGIFWAPDSRSIGFFSRGKVRTISLAGGLPKEIADANNLGGATWNSDGVILASLQNPGPLHMIPPDGSPPVPLTSFDRSVDIDHDFPCFLEDGKHFLYLSWGRTLSQNKVWAASIDKSEAPVLVADGVTAFTYVAPGYLIYIRGGVGGALVAQAFDSDRLKLTGEPTLLAESAAAPISSSNTGVVSYRSVSTTRHPLVWVGTDGAELGTALPPGYHVDPVISPDGSRVAFARQTSDSDGMDIVLLDVDTGELTQLTVESGDDRAPLWSPDGTKLAFLSFRPGAPGMYLKNANGVGAEERILASPGVLWPYQWTKAGLMYFSGTSGANDIWMMSAKNLQDRTPLIQTPFNDVDGAVSPDGHWFAYTTNKYGRWEIYLTTFPPSSTTLPISAHGGADPVWHPNGRELFYIRPSTGELMAIPVTMGNPPRFGQPRRVHPGPLFYPDAHTFDIDPDGKRLIVSPSSQPRGDITILVNWPSLLAGHKG